MATSHGAADHGIVGYVTRLKNGSLVPATSSARTAKAIWEVASDNGVSVGVAGWWASWPAETVHGWVVSDHANPVLRENFLRDGKYWTANASSLEALNSDVSPPEINREVADVQTRANREAMVTLNTQGLFTHEQVQLLNAARWFERTPYSILKTFHAVDVSTVASVTHLSRSRPVDLTMTYLRGPDPIQHYAWDLVEPEKYAVPNPFLDRDRGIVEAVYRYSDALVGDLLRELESDA